MNTDWELMAQAKRDPQVAKSIVELSRWRFGRDRKIVEAEIEERSALNEPSPVSPQQSQQQTVPTPPPTQPQGAPPVVEQPPTTQVQVPPKPNGQNLPN